MEGIPSEIVLKLIEEENIDLLILRSQKESRMESLLIGESNDEIIRTMPCSMFIVKQEPRAWDEDHKINRKQAEDGDIIIALKTTDQ
ncbi:MAG: hypothetical protein CVU51_13955 [Deltaproteobacteria bacterium HGW-Deltaproteobacteria-1]|jgi:hypothetical protein|nr:MAG: hypothetical protein CVU51_13955 [Deltaproteobacteria bacterium HGW-Deltaproteobacteria-1]